MKTVDHLVIGAGAMGLSTAWQLAKSNRNVVLLEQFELDHKMGSSHGDSRIFRVSYRDPLYTELALNGIKLWRELEAETGAVLLEQNGQIDHGSDDQALNDVKECLTLNNLEYEELTTEQANVRWPGMIFENKVIFSPDGGRSNAAQTLRSLATRVADLGVEIKSNTKVESIELDGEFAIVTTSAEIYKSKSLVVAAGGWIKHLLGEVISLPKLTIDSGQPTYYQPIDSLSSAHYWPSFIHHGSQKRVETNLAFSAYGLFTPGEGMKIGTWANTPPIDPDNRDMSINQELLEKQNEYVKANFPGLNIESANPTSCLFTNTPDEHFILDRRGPITVCSPCSGHGFKFVPILGKITADLAMGGEQKVLQWKLPA